MKILVRNRISCRMYGCCPQNITVSALYCSSYALYIPSLIYKIKLLGICKINVSQKKTFFIDKHAVCVLGCVCACMIVRLCSLLTVEIFGYNRNLLNDVRLVVRSCSLYFVSYLALRVIVQIDICVSRFRDWFLINWILFCTIPVLSEAHLDRQFNGKTCFFLFR